LQEYYAGFVSLNFAYIVDVDCVPYSCHWNGSLTLLFLPISRHSQNILHSSNHSASISVSWEPPKASRARVSLIGTVDIFWDLDKVPDKAAIQACYLEKHPDARWWLPGDGAPHKVSHELRVDGV
jgi:hypothetical protein